MLLPPGHNLIEKTFRFRFKTGIKALVITAMFLCAAPLASRYADLDNKGSETAQTKTVQEQRENKTTALSEQQRKDSLDGVVRQRLKDLVARGQYQVAIPQLTDLITRDPDNADLLYTRALCYSHTGNIADAVHDCNIATGLGDKRATQLNDKINPVVKHITGYCTQCCDGSISYARGRGACSHHGGVCNWNSPVYEESRKYE